MDPPRITGCIECRSIVAGVAFVALLIHRQVMGGYRDTYCSCERGWDILSGITRSKTGLYFRPTLTPGAGDHRHQDPHRLYSPSLLQPNRRNRLEKQELSTAQGKTNLNANTLFDGPVCTILRGSSFTWERSAAYRLLAEAEWLLSAKRAPVQESGANGCKGAIPANC